MEPTLHAALRRLPAIRTAGRSSAAGVIASRDRRSGTVYRRMLRTFAGMPRIRLRPTAGPARPHA